MTQAGLDRWNHSADNRPDEEAQFVAGVGNQHATDVIDTETVGLPESTGFIEIGVMQVNYTVDGVGDDERPVVHVFGRTESETVEHIKVLDFRPYFYAPTDSITDDHLDLDEITGHEDGYTSIRGEPLTKLFGRTPRDVGAIRDRFDHYEADILFPNRFLIDVGIKSGIRVPVRRDDTGAIVVSTAEVEPVDLIVTPRIHMMDIEVDDRSGFPEDGEEPILCLTSHDSYLNEYVAWLFVAPEGDGTTPDALPDHELLRTDAELHVRCFDDEAAMLDDYLTYVDETDADLISGWNVDDFDAPYLIDRLERLDPSTDFDLSIERLSRVNEVWRSDWQGPNIKGRVVFDLLYAYRRTQFTELDSYRLDAVAEAEVGEGKERYTGSIGDLWERDPVRLLEYNVRDVELCIEINERREVIPFWQEVRTFVGCRLEDAPTPGDTVDMYVLHKVHGKFVLPSKGNVESEEFEGGAVFDPITGVREMVAVLDLKCFSGDTDVMTPEGPRSIRDLSVGDPVYTLDPVTFECSIRPIVETHNYRNRFGRLFHLRGASYDFKVTENHRFLLSQDCSGAASSPDDFTFEEYRDIPWNKRFTFPTHGPMDGRYPELISIVDEDKSGSMVAYMGNHQNRGLALSHPITSVVELPSRGLRHGGSVARADACLGRDVVGTERSDLIETDGGDLSYTSAFRRRQPQRTFVMSDWLELMGWYLRCGTIDRERDEIALQPQTDTDQPSIASLLDRMGIPYSLTSKGVTLAPRYLVRWFVGDCGIESTGKRIPGWVFALDGRLLTHLVQAMAAGTEHITNGELMRYRTGCDDLMRSFARLIVRCGYRPTVRANDDGTWDVSVGKHGSFNKAINERVEEHDGSVYCITVEENHVVMAGRNGAFQWVGQSLYPMCMVTINASPETKVDGDFRGPTFHAPNGMSFRREPDGIIREMVDELLTERDRKKELRDQHEPGTDQYVVFDRQQSAVKVIMNSLYGVTGWERFRLYDNDVAGAVTATGREVIQHTEQAANEMGYDVVYGDSVTGDRPIVVRDPDGMVRITPIERLFEIGSTDHDATVLIAEDGNPIQPAPCGKDHRLVDGWEALSLSSDGTPEWRPIKRVIRHETDKSIVTLQHDIGESTTTTDHSYVIEENGAFVEAPPETVNVPLRIPGIPEVERVECIDLSTVLSVPQWAAEDARYFESKSGSTSVPSVHWDDEWVWLEHDEDESPASTARIQRFIDLNGEAGEAFIRLLATYISEGTASTNDPPTRRREACITGLCRAQFERLRDDFYHLFSNSTANMFECDSEGDWAHGFLTPDGGRAIPNGEPTLELRMMTELTDVVFQEIVGTVPHKKRIPSFVFHLPKRLQDLFLETLVRDVSRQSLRDASERSPRHFDYETTSRTLVAGLSTLLNQRGQHHSLTYQTASESYTIRTRTSVDETKKPVLKDADHRGYVYDLSVEANENFVDAVGGIVLHNTDSIMLELGDGLSTAGAIERGFEIEAHINASYDEFAKEVLDAENHRFQIEFEKLFRRFFQAGKKKRYAGHIIWKEGQNVDAIDITGFEYKRSDIATITKEVQRDVIERIVTGEPIDSVTSYVAEVITTFQNGEVDLDEIGIPGGIGKHLDNYETDSAHVRGAKYANLILGTNFQRGSKPKRYYLKSVHPTFFERMETDRGLDPRRNHLYGEFKRKPDVICVEYADQLPEEFEIDWETMLEKTLKGPISRVLDALDISWEEVKSGQEQTGLGQFG